MRPCDLYAGARDAVRLARECDQSADEFDEDWRLKMISEAERHRERAARYLRSRALLLRNERRSKLEIAA